MAEPSSSFVNRVASKLSTHAAAHDYKSTGMAVAGGAAGNLATNVIGMFFPAAKAVPFFDPIALTVLGHLLRKKWNAAGLGLAGVAGDRLAAQLIAPMLGSLGGLFGAPPQNAKGAEDGYALREAAQRIADAAGLMDSQQAAGLVNPGGAMTDIGCLSFTIISFKTM